jgi:hypothetical protein
MKRAVEVLIDALDAMDAATEDREDERAPDADESPPWRAPDYLETR